MKVLQTLGHRNGFPPTPFYYRRQPDGVRIESILGKKLRKTISNEDWSKILFGLRNAESKIFGVSTSENSELKAPKIHDVISEATGIKDKRSLAYISSVLVHEGSLYPDHGPRQDDLDARVFLRLSDLNNIDYATKHPEK